MTQEQFISGHYPEEQPIDSSEVEFDEAIKMFGTWKEDLSDVKTTMDALIQTGSLMGYRLKDALEANNIKTDDYILNTQQKAGK